MRESEPEKILYFRASTTKAVVVAGVKVVVVVLVAWKVVVVVGREVESVRVVLEEGLDGIAWMRERKGGRARRMEGCIFGV